MGHRDKPEHVDRHIRTQSFSSSQSNCPDIDFRNNLWKWHWNLLAGTHRPQPLKRVEIPKPDGGIRKLGVPSVVDRLIQQALLQVLQTRWDPTFSKHSYDFRPGRPAHQAVAQAQRYVADSYGVVVDFDLEKFLDRANHDGLMARVAERVADKRVLKLIRAFLNAGRCRPHAGGC